jgi:formamidopyrimidine-DNA glycosylase
VPELPEVEVLARHLAPLLKSRRIQGGRVLRARVVRPHAEPAFLDGLIGATILDLRRRAKFLVFELRPAREGGPRRLIGHLGMTGRMYLQPAGAEWPRHAAVVLELGREHWVFEDTRYFGRLTLDEACLAGLGPEPLEPDFSAAAFDVALGDSVQAIKVRLLDQSVVVGVGNIYASEALHRAGIDPRRPTRRLRAAERERLHGAIRGVLDEAIHFGSTVPLHFGDGGNRDGLFYYGTASQEPVNYEERLRVYDREGSPCHRCGTKIRRIVQTSRSSFFCPQCQR